MSGQIGWFVGLDWARDQHRACVIDAEGRGVAERDVAHDGAALAELCAWLVDRTGAQPCEIAVAIETPRGPVVEALLEHGFAVFAINPKQLDRFRDRFSLAGAKDDSLDALVLERREGSRMHDDLKQEQNRLTNRVRDQLWRYYPQMHAFSEDFASDWF